MALILSGITLLAVILSLFWLKDRVQNQWLTHFVYSGFVARLAVLGAVFTVLGLLIVLADLADNF